MSSGSSAQRLAHWLVAAAFAVGPVSTAAQTGADADARIADARNLMGSDLPRARAAAAQARAGAIDAGRIEIRLAADEIECRILSDLDAQAAETVAAAGVAAAARLSAPTPAVKNALLRLRACWAGVQLDLGKMTIDDPALTRIIEQADEPALAPARAMAQLERGLHRSRHGDLIEGQADLLEACTALARLALPRDEELCLGHLANHYKRVGDLDEALRLLRQLEASSRARDARVDRAVYVLSIGQVHSAAQAWRDALGSFEEAGRLSADLGDNLGVAYALDGEADALLHLGRPREALPRIERVLQMLLTANDPDQVLNVKLLLAATLNELAQPQRAVAVLDEIRDTVWTAGSDYQRAQWFDVDASVQANLGRWARAYESLAQWRVLTLRMNQQKQSHNAARLRMQFNRERDATELRAMQQLATQGEELRRAQATVVALAIVLALSMLLFAVRKVRQSRRLQVLASTDELTGALNRRAVMAFAEQALRRTLEDRTPLSLLLIDVDHFKRINDEHGHPAGDRVLRELAQALQASLRTSDRLGRIGGEEFLVVLPNTGSDDAAQIAERMRLHCNDLDLPTDAGRLRFSISAGVASTHGAHASLGALIAEADSALYAAKSGGRNSVITFRPAGMPRAFAQRPHAPPRPA